MSGQSSRNSLIESDSLLSDRARLAIMGAIASSSEPVSFMQLLETLELTKGNLGAHLRKLEESGYIACEKSFVDRKPLTVYQCSRKGKDAFRAYLNRLERFIQEHRR